MEPPLWQRAIAVQTDPNIFFHCRPVDGATVMATSSRDRVRSVAFTGRAFHPAEKPPVERGTRRVVIMVA